jgi:hypothetical protein
MRHFLAKALLASRVSKTALTASDRQSHVNAGLAARDRHAPQERSMIGPVRDGNGLRGHRAGAGAADTDPGALLCVLSAAAAHVGRLAVPEVRRQRPARARLHHPLPELSPGVAPAPAPGTGGSPEARRRVAAHARPAGRRPAEFLNRSALAARAWSPALVRDLLRCADACVRNPHHPARHGTTGAE